MDIEFYNKLNQALHGDAGKIDRVMRFRYLNEFVKPGQILFAGSSLMEQFPIQEFVADFDLPLTIYNRGCRRLHHIGNARLHAGLRLCAPSRLHFLSTSEPTT